MTVSRVLIDSRHIHPKRSAFDYDVRFSQLDIPDFKQVTKMELKNLVFPKIQNELYFVLKLGDMNTNLYPSGNNSNFNDCFAVVFFDNPSMAAGAYKPMKGSDLSIKQVEYEGTKPTITSLSVTALKYDGTLVQRADTAEQVDHCILLEITHQ